MQNQNGARGGLAKWAGHVGAHGKEVAGGGGAQHAKREGAAVRVQGTQRTANQTPRAAIGLLMVVQRHQIACKGGQEARCETLTQSGNKPVHTLPTASYLA